MNGVNTNVIVLTLGAQASHGGDGGMDGRHTDRDRGRDATLGGRITVVEGAVTDWLAAHDLPQRVVFCCFGAGAAALYRRRLGHGA